MSPGAPKLIARRETGLSGALEMNTDHSPGPFCFFVFKTTVVRRA
jgi:hypothetical protein